MVKCIECGDRDRGCFGTVEVSACFYWGLSYGALLDESMAGGCRGDRASRE
jgi:hypothetical protein